MLLVLIVLAVFFLLLEIIPFMMSIFDCERLPLIVRGTYSCLPIVKIPSLLICEKYRAVGVPAAIEFVTASLLTQYDAAGRVIGRSTSESTYTIQSLHLPFVGSMMLRGCATLFVYITN